MIMDTQKLNLLKEAAEVVEAVDIQKELQDFEKRIVNPVYYVALVGQFSSGKSYLLNNLLEKNLLPKGMRETTPLLTYLKYGDAERATLYYDDGSSRGLSMEEVGKIIQQDNTVYHLEQASHIEIFLPSPLLQGGMVLMDTPGNNTLISRHEMLLAQSLAVASEVIYVTNKSLTDVDISKIKDLQDHGMNLSLVMTHCDEINAEEEDFADTIRQTMESLQEKGIHIPKDKCWFISNIPASPYFARLVPLEESLMELGKHARENWDEDMDLQGEAFRKNLVKKLVDLSTVLQAQVNGNKAGVAEKIGSVKAEIKLLTDRMDSTKRKVETSLKKDSIDGKRDAQDFVSDLITQSTEQIRCESLPSGNVEEAMKLLVNEKKKAVVQRLLKRLSRNTAIILQTINADINLAQFNLEDDADIPDSSNYQELISDHDEEVNAYQARINELRKNYTDIMSELEKVKKEANAEEVQEIARIEQVIKELTQQDKELGTYKPHYIQNQGTTDSAAIGRDIGKAIDLALIFVPAGGGKLAATVGKYLSKVPTLKKAYVAAKNTKNGEKIIKGIKAGAKKVGKVAKNIQELKANSNPDNPNILDYISAEYWGGKIG
jgi:GTP-binding protein EngB required for normal cell division